MNLLHILTFNSMKNLRTLIKNIGFSYTNDLITLENFPQPEKIATEGAELIKLEKLTSSEDCLKLIEEKGCRPANIYELLAYVQANKKELKGSSRWIVALGSVFLDAYGRHRVSEVGARSDGGFDFDLGYFELVWGDNDSLLVFRDLETSTLTPGLLERIERLEAFEKQVRGFLVLP